MSGFRQRKIGLVAIFAALVGVLIADTIAAAVFVYAAQRSIPPRPPLRAVDGVVVFHGDGGPTGLDGESLRRLERARTILETTGAQGIFCTGGARASEDYFGCAMMADILVRRGVPQHAVGFDTHSNDTRSNLNEARAWIEERGWGAVVLVSDSMHLLRIRSLLVEFPDFPVISYAPYDYGSLSGIADFMHIWYRVHYEWLAWVVNAILPSWLHRDILDVIRAPYNR